MLKKTVGIILLDGGMLKKIWYLKKIKKIKKINKKENYKEITGVWIVRVLYIRIAGINILEIKTIK